LGEDRRELKRAAVRAAREAREELSRAVLALQADRSGAEHVETLESEVSRAVGRLFAAEAASGEGVIDALAQAMERLRPLLGRLQEIEPRDGLVARVTEAVASTLTVLYPAHRELERSLRPEAVEPIPLVRRRDSAPEEPEPAAPPLPPPPPPPPPARERRARERFEIAADIGFHSATNFYTGYSADISDGGLFLATYDLLPVGTELTISFMLPEGYQVTTRGHVSWLREPREADTDIRPGMGISFDSLAKDDYEAILRFTGRRPPLFYDR